MKNYFITVEGVDGAGKSTYLKTIEDHFKNNGYKVFSTREPGGTKLGDSLREILLNDSMTAETETMLMFTARKEHVDTVILPKLADGYVVICDRFNESTYAYQGYAKNVSLDYIDGLKSLVCKDLSPDITFVFDVPLNVSKQRLKKTGKTPDKFESESDDFFIKVREGYHKIADKNKNVKLVNAEGTIDEVNSVVIDICDKFIKKSVLKIK